MAPVKLDYVERLLREINDNLAPGVPERLDGVWMSRPGQGSLFLSKSEGARYVEVATQLAKGFKRDGTPSDDAIRSALNDAVFSALDLQRVSTDPIEARIRDSLVALRQTLGKRAEPFTCYVPLAGVAPAGLPARMGDVRLVQLNHSQVRRVLDAANRTAPSREGDKRRRSLLAQLKNTDSWGQAAAVVTVNAHDFKAASQIAKDKARQVVDVLNFFADLVPYQHGWIYLPGEATVQKTGAIVMRHDGALSTPFTAEGPLQLYSVAKLRGTKQLQPSLKCISTWLRSGSCPDLSSVMLAAVQWAGRASVELRREQAFLLFAIALETALLPESDPRELTYRLSLRAAHLLGRTSADRSRISGEVKRLYETRSKIVHSGFYAVGDAELGLIRRLVKTAVLRLITGREFKGLSTAKELAAWFERKALM